MLEALSLDGKVTIVTGGGTGLGRAMVNALARAGADVVIAARRPGPIEAAAQEVRGLGRRALALPTDVTDSAQVNAMVSRTLEELGKVDVLVNNAAMVGAPITPIWDMTDQEWRQGIDANLTGAFFCTRAVVKHMVERGNGKIINVASGFAMRGNRDMYTYTCGKGGLLQLTRTLAISLGRYGVTSNTLIPGFIPTGDVDAIREGLPRSAEFIPAGKFPTPQDLGPVAVFLASDASSYMNGDTIVVDGGGLAGGFAPTGHAPAIPLEPLQRR